MCGRYALYALPEEIWDALGLDGDPEPMPPRYNVAPGQDVLVVGKRASAAKPKGAMMRWGLVPAWADDPKIGNKLLNARVETFDQKPAYRQAAEKRRCLVVANGYYEWKKLADGKQPHFVRPADGSLFTFAGLWERWSKKTSGAEKAPSLFTCTVLTASAEGEVASLHDRMPVTVPPALRDVWLDPTRGAAAVRRDVLDRLAPPDVELRPVSTRVNAVANEGPENIEEAAP
jgi:putative SOS response-associated peptidase YedK